MNPLVTRAHYLTVYFVRVLVQDNVRDAFIAYVQIGLVHAIAVFVETKQIGRAGFIVQPSGREQIAHVVHNQSERIPGVQVAHISDETMTGLVKHAYAIAARPVVRHVDVRLVNKHYIATIVY
jgi:hypothetical protein